MTSASRLTGRDDPLWLILAASLWMATLANVPLWRELHALSLLDAPRDWAFAAAMALMIFFALAALLHLLAWRWTLKPAIALLLVSAATGAYFMYAYHVVIDATMLVNVFQTDRREAADLVSARMVVTVALLGVLPAVLAWRWPVAFGRWPGRLLRNLVLGAVAFALMIATVLASFQPFSSAMRNHKQLRYLINPLNSVYALAFLASSPLRRDVSRIEPIGLDARLAPPAVATGRPALLLLVLGETGRAGNFGLNGYARDTTPELSREDVVSQRNAWSCGTSTAASVPCMFSHLGRDGFDARPHNYEGLLDVIQRAGLAVLWLDNQSGCKGVCDRVPHVDAPALAQPQLCVDGECLDGVLLQGLDERIAALPAQARAKGVVLVMHQMGSHGPAYWRRSPAPYKRFEPECRSVNLQECSRESVVNAYDNSIAYTDHVLAGAIGWLKSRQGDYDTAMLYVADHGESLGENNLYLHGLPYAIAPDVQKRVPWITWLSAGYRQRTGISADCLQAARDREISHDNYFHSVLGMAGISTSLYQRGLDIYAGCARPTAAPRP